MTPSTAQATDSDTANMDPRLMTTLHLVQAAQGGDDEAREELARKYYPVIRQIVALRMGRTLRQFSDCEDIAQESIMDALMGLPGFKVSSEGTFIHWLAGIVRNNIRDHLRRLHAQKRGHGQVRSFATLGGNSILHYSIFQNQGPTPSQEVNALELHERLEDALLKMTPRHRKVIELRRLCNMEFEEVADEMELGNAASARALFARAMSRLSKLL